VAHGDDVLGDSHETHSERRLTSSKASNPTEQTLT
jgi:hypothetical protein